MICSYRKSSEYFDWDSFKRISSSISCFIVEQTEFWWVWVLEPEELEFKSSIFKLMILSEFLAKPPFPHL